MKLSPNQSLAGILEPVFAIRTEDDLGIGDTEGVRQMIDWCHRHRLNILQTLPINEISDDNSPYNALSSLAIEPATIAISPRHVPDLTPQQVPGAGAAGAAGRAARGAGQLSRRQGAQTQAAGGRVRAASSRRHFNQETERALQFRSFLMENADWLSDYALFRVLMEENGESPRLGPLGARASRAASAPGPGCCRCRRSAATS